MATGPDKPELAVVIATRNRETRLAFALEALASQEGAERIEVVVVRADGSETPLAAAPASLRTRFVEHGGTPGAAAQRNRGWREADAPLVAFIDDDSRPAPGWLAAMLAAAGDGGGGRVLQGRIEPDPAERHLLFGLARSHEITGPSPRFESGNVVYPRALLERLGGFDESVSGYAWGEDTDLGIRAREAGAEAVFVDGATVWHAVVPRTLAATVRDNRRYASLVRLLASHPELRRELFPRGFVSAAHPLLLLAVVGMLARRRPALLPALPYLAYQLRQNLRAVPPSPRSLARFVVHLPAVVASDLSEVSYTLAAAVRHRVPLV